MRHDRIVADEIAPPIKIGPALLPAIEHRQRAAAAAGIRQAGDHPGMVSVAAKFTTKTVHEQTLVGYSFDIIDEVECRSTDVEHAFGHKSPQKISGVQRARLPAFFLHDGFQKIGDAPAHFRTLDAGERDRNPRAFLGAQGLGDGGHAVIAGRIARMLVDAVEEIRHRQVKELGDGVEPSGADAVDAFFVFLNLLEAHADGLGEFFLRDALGKARGPHPAADMNVHGVSAAESAWRRIPYIAAL